MKAYSDQNFNDKPNFSEDSQSYVDQHPKKNSSSQQQKQFQNHDTTTSNSDRDDLNNFSNIFKSNNQKDILQEDEEEDSDQGSYDIEDGIEEIIEEDDFEEINWYPGKMVSTRVSLDELDQKYDLNHNQEKKDHVFDPRKF